MRATHKIVHDSVVLDDERVGVNVELLKDIIRRAREDARRARPVDSPAPSAPPSSHAGAAG